MTIEIKISKRPISYDYAMKFLKKRVENLKKDQNKELIWLLEHPTIYTTGIQFNKNHIIDRNINILKTDRGGKITLHNPGQKIVYFALNLNKRKKDIRKLISIIEKTVIEFLKIYKIKSVADKKNIGIWVKKKKISAIGIRVSKWIAYHGFSININNDLKKYLKILPCGLDSLKVTSVFQEKKINIKNYDKDLIDIFIKNLKKF